MRLIGLTAFGLLVAPGFAQGGGLTAQSRPDSIAVLRIAALSHSRLTVPMGHPTGSAYRFCVASTLRGYTPLPPLSEDLVGALGPILTAETGLLLVETCVGDSSQSGAPIVDSEGERAAILYLSGPVFGSDREARVLVHILAGGRYGLGQICRVSRSPSGTRITGGCVVQFQN